MLDADPHNPQNIRPGETPPSFGEPPRLRVDSSPFGALSDGFGKMKQRYGAVLGAALLYLLIAFAASLAGFVINLFIPIWSMLQNVFFGIPFGAGVWFIGLRLMRDERELVPGIFEGFRRYFPVIGVGVLAGLAVAGAAVPGVAIAVLGGIMYGGGNTPEIAIALIATGAVAAVFVVIWISARIFVAMPVCLDQELPPSGVVESIRLSWRATRGHAANIVLFFVLVGLINLVSALLLLRPWLLFAYPLNVASQAAMYERLMAPYTAKSRNVCVVCAFPCLEQSDRCPECGTPYKTRD